MSELARQLILKNLAKHHAGENASSLDLGNCGLTDDNVPEELAQCTHLKTLVLGSEWRGYDKVEKKWKTFRSAQSEGIRNQLTRIPDALGLFSQLESLSMRKTFRRKSKLQRIEILSECLQLKLLDFVHTDISDLTPLSELKTLFILALNATQISDLGPLSELRNLQQLYLGSTQISDISPLSELRNLQVLDLGSTQVSHFSPLSELRNLRTLKLSSTQIRDLSLFTELRSLVKLDLFKTHIVDISPLSELRNLRDLRLMLTQISDLSPLSELRNLQVLVLNSTQISDLNPLAELRNLQVLALSSTQISDLNPLAELRNLQSLNISSTQISDLKPLSELRELKILNLRSTQISDLKPLSELRKLQALDLGSTQTSDLKPLSELRKLLDLDLRSTQISDLKPLSELRNLIKLKLRSTQISDLKPLSELRKLQDLDLSSTQISDLKPLSELRKLQDLDLSLSQVRDLHSWLWGVPRIKRLNLYGTDIPGLPHEILNQGQSYHSNCYPDLKQWMEDLQAEPPVLNEDLKLMVLGNGRVGKTCLIERLTSGGYTEGQSSTHAITTQRHETELEGQPLTINYWDFGGQDIYHGTHRIFMQSRALFLLVWDWPGETETHRAAEEEAAEGYLHQNHVLPHWLDYVRSFSKGSPVITVQNKIDRDGVKAPPHQAVMDNLYEIKGSYNVSAQANKRLAGLQEGIEEVIAEMPEWLMKMPAAWHRARTALRKHAQQETDIDQVQFEAVCEAAGVRPISRPALLRYLHNAGVLYYQKGMFHDRIILDQTWMIEAIYTLFDREGLFWEFLRNDGRFTFRQLHKAWKLEKGFTEVESRLGLSFMESSEICYRLNEDKNAQGQDQEPIYVAPQLLPERISENQKALWPREGLYLQIRYTYLHQVFIQRFIVRAGHLADPEQVWRKGIWFVWQGNRCVIQAIEDAEGPGGYIQLHTEGPKAGQLLSMIRQEFDQIHPKEIQHHICFSLDGTNWVAAQMIEQARKQGQEQVSCEQGGLVDRQAYEVFYRKDWEEDDGHRDLQRRKKQEASMKDLQPDQTPELTRLITAAWKGRLGDADIGPVIDELARYELDEGAKLKFRYTRLQKNIQDRVISHDSTELEWNKLVHAVIEQINEMEEGIM